MTTADKRIADLHQKYQQAWGRFEVVCRDGAREKEADKLYAEAVAIRDKLLAIRAGSASGIWAKVQILHDMLGGVTTDEEPHSTGAHFVLRSIAEDVRRLAGAS
jgi:hypothetical protein